MPAFRMLCLLAVAFLLLTPAASSEDIDATSSAPDAVESTDLSPADCAAPAELGVDTLGPLSPEPTFLGFGSHCSGPPAPWTCGLTESGLGCPPGGACTYTCRCDECTFSDGRTEVVRIDCTLVDDGGCLACPM